VAVSPDAGRVEFALVPVGGGRAAAFAVEGQPRKAVKWREVAVQLDPGEYQILIRDERATGWVALSAPRENATLGHWAQRAQDTAGWWFALGSVGLVAALAWPRGERPRAR
jgi:hypothetical protein